MNPISQCRGKGLEMQHMCPWQTAGAIRKKNNLQACECSGPGPPGHVPLVAQWAKNCSHFVGSELMQTYSINHIICPSR